MAIVDLTNPIIMLVILMLFVVLIIVGKKVKISYIPLVGIVTALVIFLYNSSMLFTLQEEYEYLRTDLIRSELWNLALIALSFIGYLWVDDVEAKFKNKKSIDNSMDWFWNKV